MKIVSFCFYLLLGMQLACAQPPAIRPAIEHADFDQKLSQLLSFSVPLIGVEELHAQQDKMVLLDTRDREEYEVSHLPGARFAGYTDFDPNQIKDLPKDTPIVLYCSVGYRSEKIGERLQKAGYTQVYNLYGSLFEWANHDYPLVDINGEPTTKVHTYNRNWSKWVEDGPLVKTW